MKAIITALTILLISSLAPAFAGEKATDKADRQILGILVAVNKNEIAAAQYIKAHKVDAEVSKYAQLMIKDHTANLHQTMSFSHKVGSPMPSDDSKALVKEGHETLASLKKLKGKELEKTYIDDMVKGHEAVLQTIDDNLLKNVTNEQLKKQIEATREHVDHHLEAAKEIQSKLG
jgi:putative membrane protein